MPRIFLTESLSTTMPDTLAVAVERIFASLQDQLNGNPAIAALNDTNRKMPVGMQNGDLIFDSKGGELRVGIYNGINVLYASFGSFVGAITDSQHGTRSGGTLHPVATSSVAGFMSAADKSKSDNFLGDTSSALPPAVGDYPSNKDYGYHTDTNTGFVYLARNFLGTIKSVQLT